MSRRLLNWRILLALFFCASLALAPAIAEARAGSSSGGRSSSMGSRGLRTYENNNAQPLGRSSHPFRRRPRNRAKPGRAVACLWGRQLLPAPSVHDRAGGRVYRFLAVRPQRLRRRRHLGRLGDGHAAGGFDHRALIYFAVRLFRGRAFSNGWPGGTPFSMAALGGSGRRTGAAESRARHQSVRCRPQRLSGDPRRGSGGLERG